MPHSARFPDAPGFARTFLGRITLLFTAVILVSCSTEKHPIPGRWENSGPPQADLSDWQKGRFSMFIHFGLYSLAGGVWNDIPVTIGYSEQIRSHGKISKEDYRKLALKFNPVKWNPDSIVLLAKAAGMKSLVITAKHHDGFALFSSKYSTFNIVEGTPYKKDLLLGLSEACARHGLKFGVYFSLIDWDYDGAAPPSAHNSDTISASHHRLNMGQVEELVTGYGKISELWFDMGKPTPEQSRELAALVRKHQPGCMISGRIWNDMGDFAVMGDNASPDFKMGRPWQTPASMFDETWGYRSWQIRNNPDDKATEKLKSLVRTIANGGNYLLNIGPMGDGTVVAFEKQVLLKMGQWIEKNYEAVMEPGAINAPEQSWGYITGEKTRLWLFLVNPPATGRITLKGLRTEIASASTPEFRDLKFKIIKTGPDPVLEWKQTLLNNNTLPVIQIDLKKEVYFEPEGIISPPATGPLLLNLNNATIYHSYSGKDYYTTVPTVVQLEWNVRLKNESVFTFNFSIPEKSMISKFYISINNRELLIEPGLKSILIPDIEMQQGLNKIIIRPEDQSNPHRDQGLGSINIAIQ